MSIIQNPILKGFNPDPSIIRVKDDYYIATSTFEWFPGVQIHHSKDLIHWNLIAHPLNRTSQLNMIGEDASCGIWAPDISYDNNQFYLIYTDVKASLDDVHNYLVTTEDITGEWSEPIPLHGLGFDASLFHDDDGRKWLVSMISETRKGKSHFGGIVIQEYSETEKKLIGPYVNIFQGTELGVTEGPHIYKRNGYYYLLTAEGGTVLRHAVTLARSRSLMGPYEVCPNNPILTSRYAPENPLQKAGHADIVETQNGDWYMVHLCGRPIARKGRCTLGRETSIQKIEWTEDDWIQLAGGGNQPFVEVHSPNLPECIWKKEPERDDFDSEQLNINFQTLRIPLGEDMLSLKERPGYLRLKGKESLKSRFHQSLVARRQQAFCYTASTCLEFEPEIYKQAAGLICLYDNQNYFYLQVSYDEEYGGKCLSVMNGDNGQLKYLLDKDVCVEGWKEIYLKVHVNYDLLQFYYSKDGEEWVKIGPICDASQLSDEYCKIGKYTGAFVGLCCQDLTGSGKYADFDYFEYIEE